MIFCVCDNFSEDSTTDSSLNLPPEQRHKYRERQNIRHTKIVRQRQAKSSGAKSKRKTMDSKLKQEGMKVMSERPSNNRQKS